MKTSWETFLNRLESDVGVISVDRWLRTLKIVRFDAGNLYLEARDPFQILWFEEHVRPRTKEWFLRPNGKPVRIHLSQPGEPTAAPKEKKSPVKAQTKPQPVITPPSYQLVVDELDPLCTFDHFFSTEGNLLAYKIFNEVAGRKPENDQITHLKAQLAVFNPIYVHGRTGTGKTHVLMAMAHALAEKGLRPVFVRAETFTENVVTAIRAGEMAAFRKFYRDCDVLIVDDVHLFSRKAATQEELFHTFNTLHVNGKQMILASGCSPQELQFIEPRLISRFEWGVVLPLEPLKPSEYLQVLRAKAKALQFALTPHVEEFLIDHFNTNPKTLCQAFEALVLRAHLQNRRVLVIEDLKELLSDFLSEEEKRILKPDQVLQHVAESYGIRVDDILGRGQTREMVAPRQLAMYFCRQQLKMPFNQIGELFKRDHSTVMSSVRQVQRKLDDADQEFVAIHTVIEKKLTV